MKIAYFDAFSGISGDMTVGAFLALGMPLDHLRAQLAAVDVHGYSVRATEVHVQGIQAVKFDVEIDAESRPRSGPSHRPFRQIRDLLEKSDLARGARESALRIFARLAEAEGRVHGVATDDVTFHEVGAIDSIVDVVGAAVGADFHGVERVYVSELPGGSGTVQTQHGLLPVPPPATVELLKGFSVRHGDGEGELVTPTGAAIVAALAETAPVPPLRVGAVGYGAGSRTLRDRPNVLRVVLGGAEASFDTDRMLVLETNVDDTNPELYDFVFERLFEEDAVDVHLVPVHMKKNRPGVLLRVLCRPQDRDRLAAVVLRETTAIGLRFHPVDRLKLRRETVEVRTEHGSIRVKVARAPDGTENVAPEYDDCARVARARKIPLKRVYQAALAAYWKR